MNWRVLCKYNKYCEKFNDQITFFRYFSKLQIHWFHVKFINFCEHCHSWYDFSKYFSHVIEVYKSEGLIIVRIWKRIYIFEIYTPFVQFLKNRNYKTDRNRNLKFLENKKKVSLFFKLHNSIWWSLSNFLILSTFGEILLHHCTLHMNLQQSGRADKLKNFVLLSELISCLLF